MVADFASRFTKKNTAYITTQTIYIKIILNMHTLINNNRNNSTIPLCIQNKVGKN